MRFMLCGLVLLGCRTEKIQVDERSLSSGLQVLISPNSGVYIETELLCSAEAIGETDTAVYFATEELSGGDWTCSVTPCDGENFGSSLEATVFVESGCPSDGNGHTIDCPATDCLSIKSNVYDTNGSDLYWIDPGGSGAFQAYCDMSTDGGGWTLVLHQDTTIDETLLGLGGDYLEVIGTSLAYSRLPIQSDVMLEVSDTPIFNDDFEQRTIINGVHTTALNKTLFEIWNGTTPVYLDDQFNTNVVNEFANGETCASDPSLLPYGDYGDVTCQGEVITLMDIPGGNGCNISTFLIGASNSYTIPWGNCNGWPSKTYSNFPEVIRFWIR